jgi:hypothetical protein
MGEVTNLASGGVDLEGWLMKWMRNHELPPWAYLLGGLSLASGSWINVLTKNVLLGIPLICVGTWLIRWWLEVPADHPRFQKKMSERRFRFYRNIMSANSWAMLIVAVAVVSLSIFGVLP